MRVALAVHGTHKYGGIPKYGYMLANTLTYLGVQVRVIVDSDAGADRLCELYPNTHFDIDYVYPTIKGSASAARQALRLSAHLARFDDFDVLHCSHVSPFFYLRRRMHRPVVFQPFGNELFTLAGKGIGALHCAWARYILTYCGAHADALLMEGEFQRADMTRWYGNPAMRVLPVGVDTARIKPKCDYEHGDTFRFLTVNSLYPYEHIDQLIMAFGTAYRVRPFIYLTIVGTGPEEARLKAMCANLPVIFLKNIPEDTLNGIRAESDCYVSVSEESDYQMGEMEAMAAGLPVIKTGTGASPEGVLRTSFRDLSDTMLTLARLSAASRATIGQHMRQAVLPFSAVNIARQAQRIYEEVA